MSANQALTALQHWALKATEVVRLRAPGPMTRNAVIASAALGLVIWANRVLNRLSLNNWTKVKKGWDNEHELVLITGGCSGIGKAIASSLVKKGVRVVVLDIQEPEYTQDEDVAFYRADVTSSESIRAAAIKIRADHGSPTVLVNNAGIGKNGPILEKSEGQIRQTFNANTISHFLMVKEFLPDMIKKNHGHVVTIASVASFLGLGGSIDYCCSKASALAFHEGLSQELSLWYNAPKVRTSIIHPSWVRTPMIERLISAGERFGQTIVAPEVVAEAVVRQILAQRGCQIILPETRFVVSLLRAFPSWIQRGLGAMADRQLKDVHDWHLKFEAGTKLI
ncbi:hypothetical protein TMatcc_005655 [Talaromyces marneffei ATCC 18224]|uniref:Short-chain dehydrogenase/reductase 3 n=2 Tax=Talaromyces marneffei TaxID=37727 RepID=B6Q9E9_TALMQ|nr:uncharacterized protein EYB26_005826 [Talaromyces marneffei]EEA26094.1 short-chain dehydrogenase, putative [Talaromyces marneffei ATCC 18224]KAE8554805.1 hypothetical protein EYB25_003349 [Talaromyces marneffei]QGA18145.1 hypothetical protein EYB26_005826 [Talaromyces marneffei]